MVKRKREEDSDVAQLSPEYLDKHSDEFKTAVSHILSVDPSLKEIIEQSSFHMYLKDATNENSMEDYFRKLSRSIIGQQISGIAAKKINERIVELFKGKFPNYKDMHHWLQDPDQKQQLKDCGLSQRKLLYFESLTDYFYNNEHDIELLFQDEDEGTIIEKLVANIKGIGPWSAKLFLVSGLHKQDIFSAEDLGIARGCSRYLEDRPEVLAEITAKRTVIMKSKIKHKNFKWKIHDHDIVELCGDLFRPYRTLFMFILWRMSDTNVDVVLKNESDFVST